jgi:hypothetical protein
VSISTARIDSLGSYNKLGLREIFPLFHPALFLFPPVATFFLRSHKNKFKNFISIFQEPFFPRWKIALCGRHRLGQGARGSLPVWFRVYR